MRYCRTFFPRVTPSLRARRRGLDGGHAPAGIALMAGEASGLLDAWASSPGSVYLYRSLNAVSSRTRKPGHHLIQVRPQRLDHFVEVVELGQHLTDQEGVMGTKAPGQGLAQRRELATQCATRQIGQDVGIVGALREGVEHGAPGDPEDITGHRRQLDAGVFEHLLEPIGLAGVLADQRGAIAREITQFSDRRWRHKAAPQDRKSTRLNSSHLVISYAVFCLKKKTTEHT